MVQKIHIGKFLELSELSPVLDVRSPAEFNHGHFPGAYSLPLFTDEERRIVGTTYKQQGRQAAIKIGLQFFGPQMKAIVERVESIVDASETATLGRTILMYCWRGGMRSAAIAWLLDLYGFKVYTLEGGYKSFRGFILESFGNRYKFRVLGGYTGSGKTRVLEELSRRGQLVINLEAHAHHRGSAFGGIGQKPQPTQEMFENSIGLALHHLAKKMDLLEKECIWIEDESQRIGTVNIPPTLWSIIRQSPITFLKIPFDKRIEYLLKEYGNMDKIKMDEAIVRIQKRLGGLEAKNARDLLSEERLDECFRILLTYYDKWYLKGLHNRSNLPSLLHELHHHAVEPVELANMLTEEASLA